MTSTNGTFAGPASAGPAHREIGCDVLQTLAIRLTNANVCILGIVRYIRQNIDRHQDIPESVLEPQLLKLAREISEACDTFYNR